MSNHPKKGEIHVKWEPPDLLVLVYKGDIWPDEMTRAIEKSHYFIRAQPYHLALLDVTHFLSMKPEARKLAVASSEKENIRGAAVVGASFHVRALGSMLIRAAQIFYKGKDNPTEFFNNEKDARAWLEQRRRILANEYGATKNSSA
jgi:SpoIIAA-like